VKEPFTEKLSNMNYNKPQLTSKKLTKLVKRTAALSVVLLLITAMMVNFTACCTYSFTGASVPDHLETIAVPIAEDRSGAGLPGLRELLTQELIRQFIDDNSLQVTSGTKANAIVECTIVSVTDVPSIVGAGENIEQRRLTVNVQVVYKDLVKRVNVFDKSFSNYGDYVPGTTENERVQASEVAVNKISEDIVLAVISGW
jgi:hypothetical protein